VVECDLAKVEVAGSNPVSRSSRFLDFHRQLGRRKALAPHVFASPSNDFFFSGQAKAEITHSSSDDSGRLRSRLA
jgi:hypothetical protein